MDLNNAKIEVVNIIVDQIKFIGYKEGQNPQKSKLSIPLEKFKEKKIIRDDIKYIMEALKKDGLVLEYYDTSYMVNESFSFIVKKYRLLKYYIEGINDITIEKIDKEERKELEQKFEKDVYLVPNLDGLYKYLEICNDMHNKVTFKDGILHFKGKDIIISKTKDSNHYYLIKTLFEEPNRSWDYGELWESLGKGEYDKDKWQVIYQAGRKINDIVAKDTMEKDFLIITKKEIIINDKYLK